MSNNKGSLRSTRAVSLTNYLDAGAIVAGASGLTLWKNYLGLAEVHLGWLNFISANCLGAAIGAIIGGFLADKYGRKFIYTYNLLVYMLGVQSQFPYAVGWIPYHGYISGHWCTGIVDLYL